MSKVANFISGTRILEEADSKVNGKLTVIRDLAWGTYIKGGGLTQSGGIAAKIWNTTLKDIRELKIENCLILGLGGGSIAGIVHKLWPASSVTGIDVDPVIVNLGKKYLGLDDKKVKIILGDASNFPGNKYDLICIDTYLGDEFPRKFESKKFLTAIKSSLTPNGIAIFNRLYYAEKRAEAHLFNKKLEEIFPDVKPVYPEANIMFISKIR